MGLLGGSNPWPRPFGTTPPSTSAVGRHTDISDTSDTQTLDTQTRSDTRRTSQLPTRALRHSLDTGQTPLTLPTPVSMDTAQTRLRHCSEPDTSDTQTQQGSAMADNDPPGRGEERLRATRPRSNRAAGPGLGPRRLPGSGARRATAGLGGNRAEMAAPSTPNLLRSQWSPSGL